MTAYSVPTCGDNIQNASKGFWHLASAGSCSLAVIVIAAAAAALALLLLGFDGLFVYSIGSQAPIHLLWAIPVTFSFLVMDVLLIKKIGTYALSKIVSLSSYTHSAGTKALHHFQAIHF